MKSVRFFLFFLSLPLDVDKVAAPPFLLFFKVLAKREAGERARNNEERGK